MFAMKALKTNPKKTEVFDLFCCLDQKKWSNENLAVSIMLELVEQWSGF